ncbi:MAG: hypothetical protein AB1585_04680 [Thermodesulfobacteriota bacterium]
MRPHKKSSIAGNQKRVILMLIAALFLWAFPGRLLSAGQEANPVSNPIIEKKQSFVWGTPTETVHIGLGYLFSRSEGSWEISFPEESGLGRSILRFQEMRGAAPLAALDINHPRGLVSLSLEYSKGQLFNGQGTDTDYQSGDLYHRSRFDVDGETAFWLIDLQTAFSSAGKQRWVLKPFLGWQHYEDRLKMTNGCWTQLYGEATQIEILGLDSRYDFTWDALRIGAKGEIELLEGFHQRTRSLIIKSHLALFPYIEYRGRGVWNLREDFKKDPSFIHEADTAGILGLDWGLSLVYKPLKHLEFEGGGRLITFYAESGRDRTYFSNGAVVDVTLEEARTLRTGLFLKITGRF